MSENEIPEWLRAAPAADGSRQGRDQAARGVGKQILAVTAGFALLGLIFLLNRLIFLIDDPSKTQRYYDRCMESYKEHKYKDAKYWLTREIETNPKFDQAYFSRALAHQRAGEVDEAIADYTSFIRLKPEEAAAYYNRGLAYRDRGDREQALADFAEAGRLKPDDPESDLRRVEIYRGAGDFAHASALLDTLIGRYDHQLTYRYARAALHRETGDLDGAIRDIDAVIAITDDRASEPYLERGRLRHESGDTAGAIADFDQAIARNPDDLRPYLERGVTYRDIGRLDAARAEFDAAIARKADLATGYMQRGVTGLFMLGDAAAAEDLSAALNKGFDFAISTRVLPIGIWAAQCQLGLPETTIEDNGDLLAPGVPFQPSVYYLIVWRHIAQLRAGQDDAAEFEGTTSRLEMELWSEARLTPPLLSTDRRAYANWPGPILALFAGQATPDAVRRDAEAAPGAYARRLRICEAEFYTAEYDLTKNEGVEARKVLQAASQDCPANAPEAAFAKAELKRLEASPAN